MNSTPNFPIHSDVAFFARLQMPADYIDSLKKEESKTLRRAINGQLVAIPFSSMYGFGEGKGKVIVWPIGGRQDEGSELYVPPEYIKQNISEKEQNIAQALYDSFWQREEYTESIDKILSDVLSCCGETVKTEKLDDYSVRVTHSNGYTSTWVINSIGGFTRVIIHEPKVGWNSSNRCFNQELKKFPLSEEVLDALCGS